MYRRSWLAVAAVTLLAITLLGCQGQEESQKGPYLPQAPIEVHFGTDPEAPHPAGEPLTLFVQVSQEGEPVEDADEVTFEIWRADEDEEESEEQPPLPPSGLDGGDPMAGYETDHDMLPATHAGEGVYQLEHTFDEPGLYYVMYHVTARGYHDMVRYELEIVDQ